MQKQNITVNDENAGHYIATAENFTYVLQNFEVGNYHYALKTGFIVKKMIGGFDFTSKSVDTPMYVPEPMRFSLDNELFQQLSNLKDNNKRLYLRILSAADLFFEGYFNDPYLSINARTLLQCSAFETLLGLADERAKRRAFKEKVTRYLVKPTDYKGWHMSPRTNGLVKEINSLKVIWADKFYVLRNKITHGLDPKPEDFIFWRTSHHLDIAPMFFIAFIKEILNEQSNSSTPPFLDTFDWQRGKGFIYEDNSLMIRLSRIV